MNSINSFTAPVERDDYFKNLINLESRNYNLNKYNLNYDESIKNTIVLLKFKAEILLNNLKNISNDQLLEYFNQNNELKSKMEYILKFLNNCPLNNLKSELEKVLSKITQSNFDTFVSLENEENLFFKSIVLCNFRWGEDFQSFESYELNPGLKNEDAPIKHRLYICMDQKYLSEFCMDLTNEFEKRNMRYYFKARIGDFYAKDPCVLYLRNEEEIYKTIAIIRYLMNKKPEYKDNILYPASHLFLVDNYIGYGTESNDSKFSYSETLNNCFNNIKNEAFVNSIEQLKINETLSEYLEKMKLEMAQTLNGPLYQSFKLNYKKLFEQLYFNYFGNNIEKFENYEEKIKQFEKTDPEMSEFYKESKFCDDSLVNNKLEKNKKPTN